VTGIPNQSQEMLPARPTLPSANCAPLAQHQATSAACLVIVCAFEQGEALVILVIDMILRGVEFPNPRISPGALQLNGVHVPFVRREEPGPLQAGAAWRKCKVAQELPLDDRVCFLDHELEALDLCDCLGASDAGPGRCVAVAVDQVVDWGAVGDAIRMFLCALALVGWL